MIEKNTPMQSSTAASNHTVRIMRPLIPVVISVVIGMVLAAFFPGHMKTAAAGAVILAVLLTVQIIQRRSAFWVPLLFCLVSGYLSLQPWLSPMLPGDHVVHFADQGFCRVEGVVADIPRSSAGGKRWRWVLDVDRISNAHGHHRARGKVQVTARRLTFVPHQGDRLIVGGRLRTIRNFMNPGGFDYKRYLGLQGLFCRIYGSAKHIRRTEESAQKSPAARISRLRSHLAGFMATALSNHDQACRGVLQALVLGDRSGIDNQLRDIFNRTGVGHLLAISGLHIGMVAAFSYFLAVWGLSWVPWATSHAWTRRGACLFTFGPVLFYAILAGMTPATQRAALMVAVVLAGRLIGRGIDLLNTAALAALVIVAVAPPTVLSASFQLSFCAVLAIIIGLQGRLRPATGSGAREGYRRVSMKAINLLRVSLLAILGTLPLTLYYFNQMSFVGLGVNLIAVPLTGAVVVPFGLLGVALTPLNVWMAHLCWQVAAWGLDGLLFCITRISQWSWVAAHTVTPGRFEIVLFYGLLILLLTWKRRRGHIVALCVLLALVCADAGYWVNRRFLSNRMTVTALDVGQGSAALLELPKGYTILVDGGGFADRDAFDVGKYIVAPFLWQNKINTVDLVVLSHPNNDHLNGLLYVLEHFNVGEVWSNHERAPTFGYRQWQRLIKARRIKHTPFEHLAGKSVRNGVTLKILAPPGDFADRSTETWRDLNNNSLVLKVEWGTVSFLFTGDIGRPAEQALVRGAAPQTLLSTILFVPHHGSKGSSCEQFLSAVSSKEAVISAGYDNRFGFPAREVIHRLARENSRIWRTDKHGAIRIQTDGQAYRIRPFQKECE